MISAGKRWRRYRGFDVFMPHRIPLSVNLTIPAGQLRRSEGRDAPGRCACAGQRIEQPRGEFASADAGTGAQNAWVQISRHAQRFLATFGVISSFFRPGRNLLRAVNYREIMRRRFAEWSQVVESGLAFQ